MLTDTQLTGLRLALDNAKQLGVDPEPWELRDRHGWVRMEPDSLMQMKLPRTPKDVATREHYDALCARYARKLRDQGCMIAEDERGWFAYTTPVYCNQTPDTSYTRINCPDDELTALVHALADAEGKGVVR